MAKGQNIADILVFYFSPWLILYLTIKSSLVYTNLYALVYPLLVVSGYLVQSL
jgi:hypothetical protein